MPLPTIYRTNNETPFYIPATVPDIDENADYPPILVTTSTRDDRVHPGHARKFVKVRRIFVTLLYVC